MLGLGARIFAIAAALALMSLPAGAAKRLALVIGNSDYQHALSLPNPTNDAADVATALRDIGFAVIEQINVGKDGVAEAISEFSRQLTGADTAVFFYAGHAIQFDGRNYLIPVDAKIEIPADVRTRTVDLSAITEEMERQTPVNLIFLDACRDNPFAHSLVNKTRSASSRGLALTQAGIGTLIAFATAPDRTASDGTGRNSPFTAALLQHIKTPGLEIRQMLSKVRADVVDATGKNQVPWDNSSLIGNVYLVAPTEPPQTSIETKPSLNRPAEPKKPRPDSSPDPDEAYRRAQVENTPEAYEALLRKFPNHPRAEAIRKLITRAYDERMWNTVRKQNTIAAYEQYRDTYPKGIGIFFEEATRRIAVLREAQRESELVPSRREPADSEERTRLKDLAARKTAETTSGIGEEAGKSPLTPMPEPDLSLRQAARTERGQQELEQPKKEDHLAPQQLIGYWNHNGSLVFLEKDGNSRKFYYDKPRSGMMQARAKPGSLLFEGRREKKRYSGTAYIYAGACGTFPYHTSGVVINEGKIVMTGQAPVVDRTTCRITSHKLDRLVFDYQFSR